MKFLFDTNILIYHFTDQLTDLGTSLLREGIAGEGAYPVAIQPWFHNMQVSCIYF
jgi:hypothetical protein